MNNNNNKTELQFTELTPNDVVIHEDLYIELLMSPPHAVPNKCKSLYYDCAVKELAKAKEVFSKTFE